MIRTELDSAPEELDTLRRKIMQLEIEQAALKKETDRLSKERLSQLEKELSDMRDQFQAMSARWENEKAGIGKVQKLREEIEQVNAEIARAEQEYDLNKAAELKYGRLPELQKQLAAAEQAAEAEAEKNAAAADDSDADVAEDAPAQPAPAPAGA